MRCPGASGSSTYTNGSPCTWKRALCVTCRSDSGTVKIRVQTNNLPNHCINSTVNNAVAQMQDWEVAFSPASSGTPNYATTAFDSSAKTDEILCDIQRTSKTNMNAWSSYTLKNTMKGKGDDPIGT